MLRTFVLVFVFHELSPSGGSLPINRPVIISRYVFFYLLKLLIVAQAPDFLDTKFSQMLGEGEQLILTHLDKGWVDWHFLIGRKTVPSLYQSEG